jgi:hypothetical protein
VHLCFGSRRAGQVDNSTDFVHKFFLSAADDAEFEQRYAALRELVAESGWEAV